jgi:hypothetical protein
MEMKTFSKVKHREHGEDLCSFERIGIEEGEKYKTRRE